MSKLTVTRAESPAELDAVRQLCRDFVTWQITVFPEMREAIETYFEPIRWEQTLADLPQIHARPKGAIFLAQLSKRPVGCIMYLELEPDVAEVKRLYVSADARGAGAGSALVSTLLDHARADGYRKIQLDTAKFLTQAQLLYAKHGFVPSAPPDRVPEEIRDLAVFMAQDL